MCLQCIGKIFDLGACSDPACPASYQNSLQEHDGKAEQFCPACAKALKAALHEDALGEQHWAPEAPPPMGLRF